MWIFLGVCGWAFESSLIFQQINVNRIFTLTGSDSIGIIQSVHLFVWDEAQRQGVTLYSIVIMELGYLKKTLYLYSFSSLASETFVILS